MRNEVKDLLTELKEFKFEETLALEFKKVESDDKTKYNTFYLSSKVEKMINESDIDDVFESIYMITISKYTKIKNQKYKNLLEKVRGG